MKKHTSAFWGFLVTMLCLSAPARADQACPTTEDANNAILHADGFTPPASGTVNYFMGQFNFFGVSTVGVCIIPSSTGVATLHAVLDAGNHLLGWLPKINNHLCLTDLADVVTVVQFSQTQCGVTMSPLNYNGNILSMYGKLGNDNIAGGNGIEQIYGGGGLDVVTDFTTASANPIYLASLFGETGNDIISGSAANNTELSGADGNDYLSDIGGTGESLKGGNGNECCMIDSNGAFSQFDCNAGTDTVNVLGGGRSNCEVASSSCSINNLHFCP